MRGEVIETGREHLLRPLYNLVITWRGRGVSLLGLSRREITDKKAEAVQELLRDWYEEQLLLGIQNPPSTNEELETAIGSLTNRFLPSHQRQHAARLLRTYIDHLRHQVVWHAKESGHLEEYQRGYADGLKAAMQAVDEPDYSDVGTGTQEFSEENLLPA